LPFHYQLGFMGLLMTGTAVLFEYLRHHWTVHKPGSSKRLEEAEDLADELIDPLPRRARRYGKGVLLGLALGGIFLLALSALTYDFGFFFVFPISAPYFIVSLIAAFLFSFGIEWLFRRHIQVLIDEVEPYYKRRTIKILTSVLMVVLPSVIVLGLVRFAAVITPTAYFLFYTAAGLCPVLNWYLFDHTKSLIPTVTFSTLVLGWILAGCLTPAFF
jgi:hypothetical protein